MAKNPPIVPETTVAGSTAPTEPVTPVTNIGPSEADIQARIDAEVAKRMAALAPPKGPKALAAPVDLDERIAMGVAKAMEQAAPAMARAFGTAMMAAQHAQAQTEHDKIMAKNKAKLALEEKCSCCRQSVGDGKRRGCGGPWRRDARTNEFILEPVYVIDPQTKEVVLDAKGDKLQELDGEGKPVFRRIEDFNQFHIKMVVFPHDPVATKWFFGVGINGAWYQSQGPNHEIWVPRKNDLRSIEGNFTINEVEQRVGRSHVRQFGGSVSGRGGTPQGGPGLGVGFQ